jgi:hypothetical protein
MRSAWHIFFVLTAQLFFGSDNAHAIPLESWDSKINSPKRFLVLVEFNGEAVLDKETGPVLGARPHRHRL